MSPSRNNNADTLKFTPASGPSIDEAYSLKPGVIGPRNLMSVSISPIGLCNVMIICYPCRCLLKLQIIEELQFLL